MQYLYIVFISIYLIFFSSCIKKPTDPLENKYAKDPEISFKKVYSFLDTTIMKDTIYYASTIHQYSNEKKILILVGEYNRSDGKPCPGSGKDLYFTIKSNHGEKEIFSLNTPYPNWLDSQDNITLYLKYIYPKITDEIIKGNNIVEINIKSDTLIAYYRSYWHDHLVTDSLFYNP